MENYQRIMSLVEDVRDILDLHEAKKKVGAKEMAALKKKMGKPSLAQADEKAKDKIIAKKHGGKTKHNPFKNLKKGKNLGPTSSKVAKIKGPSTTTPGSRKGKWRCRCHGYKCLCTGKSKTGAAINKTVRISKSYKKGYNARYKAWREKNAKHFAAGGKRGFKKAAKPHHKHYHAD